MKQIAVPLIVIGIFLALKSREAAATAGSFDGSFETNSNETPTDIYQSIQSAFESAGEYIMGGWWNVVNKPENSDYLRALHNAEQENGIPENLLVSLAYQESHFRPDIISGQTRSSAGAVGIMQIVPKWHPSVNALDPFDSIRYAGKFLREMYNRFGNWTDALRAYNWGPGNLSQYLKGNIEKMPQETLNYSAQIIARVEDVGGPILA